MVQRRTPPSLRPFGPRRQQGIRPLRKIPSFPRPPVRQTSEDVEEQQYRIWEVQYSGTYPEYIAWKWLTQHGYTPDVDFIYQSSRLGGRSMPGGAVVDIDFPGLLLAWRIQGERFHLGSTGTEAKDQVQKLSLTGLGYTVVDILAEDLIERRNYVLSRAIQGEQIHFVAGVQ